MQIFMANNYDPVRCYLMAYPCYFDVTDSSNPNKGTVDKSKVFAQYNSFVNYLTDQGVKVQLLDIVNSTEQVFARDIGFVVSNIFFVSKMQAPERAGEIQPLLRFIQKHGLKHHIMQNGIEGGDVIHDGGVLFIGVGGRTSEQAVAEVQSVLDRNQIKVQTVAIRFDVNKIHLDCAFNTLDQHSCVITDYVYDPETIQQHVKNCIKMNREIADDLGTNFIYLGGGKVVTHSEGARQLLNAHGYQTQYMDYGEIVKARGSLGCCTLPVLRSVAP